MSGKYPIDRPCSACSGGDSAMEYHDHEPPYRKGYGPKADDPGLKKARHDFRKWQKTFGGLVTPFEAYMAGWMARYNDARTVRRETAEACLTMLMQYGVIGNRIADEFRAKFAEVSK